MVLVGASDGGCRPAAGAEAFSMRGFTAPEIFAVVACGGATRVALKSFAFLDHAIAAFFRARWSMAERAAQTFRQCYRIHAANRAQCLKESRPPGVHRGPANPVRPGMHGLPGRPHGVPGRPSLRGRFHYPCHSECCC